VSLGQAARLSAFEKGIDDAGRQNIDVGICLISSWKKIGDGADHKLEESATRGQTRVTRDFAPYIEVVFVGSDAGEEGGRQIKMQQNFTHSTSVADAMNPNDLLCYEMNGELLPLPHGFPPRLIAPGWYGIANVKRPRRIEVRDTRFMGRFMGRDDVTIREDQRDGESAWMETSVG
jgi:hypothetical protein